MTELPPAWAWATVDDLAVARGVIDGPFGSNLKTSHYTADGARVIRLQNIGDGAFRDERAYIAIEHFERLRKHSVEPFDVLVASLGEQLPRACLAPEYVGPAIVKADCVRIRTNAAALAPYLMWALNSTQVRDRVAASIKGVGRPRVNLGDLRALEVPVAPRAEQERIVAAIEEAFSKLDAGEAALRTARQRLKRMRDAVLTAAVTGRLVPQDPTNPPSADRLATHRDPACAGSVDRVLRTLGDVADWSSGGTPKAGTARFYGGPIPWAVIGDLTEGPVWHTQSSLTAEGLERSSAKVVPEGTVLLAMYGASIGRIGVTSREMATNQAIACARPRTDVVTSSYLFWYLRSQRRAFVAQGKGAAQPNISQTIIKTWPVALPPVEEQNRIVADVERQFSFIEACERAVDRGLARAAALRRSVLKAAFEGRLVPQDPSDEPASALLDRIRAERAAGGSPKLRRTRPVRSGS